MLFAKNLTKSFGTQTLFAHADFQLNPGEKVGVVGRNGSGKSTLFRLIRAQEVPDEGTLAFPEHYRIGGLDQHLTFNQKTIRDQVAQSLPQAASHDIWKAEKLLSGLGFSTDDFDRSPDFFSGGFQIRIKLAELLLSQPDLLLLDEPTNYLDILTIRWLERFLKSWKGELICISHDQSFLERITTHTMAVHRAQFKKIKGSPAKCYAQIKKEEELHERTRENQKKETAKQEKFIREFRSGARSAGLVQSRIKMLEKREKLSALAEIPPIKFHFSEAHFNAAKMVEAHNLVFGYKGGDDLLKKLSFEILPGDKIGIVGANGKGKSTLLKVLNGDLKHQSGTLKYHPNTHIGYMGQSNVDKLDAHKTILEELQSVPEVGEPQARSVAGSLLFSGGLAQKPIKVLSGGEKARVNLGKVLLSPVNLLLLDEPTNHLDYESVEAFTKAVKAFDGAVLLVSHNESFLHEVAEKLVVFDGDEVYFYPSDYQTFLREKGFASEREESISGIAALESKKERPVHQAKKKEKERLLRPLKRELERIEKQISILEIKQKENTEAFKKADKQGNRLKMETLGIQYQDLQKRLEKLWEEWNALAEAMEKIYNPE
ncbi:MAG TPA: ABC-F family ATP-binding cassette domain-containing protein [Candidatus Gracilibacteria bacterium]